MPKLCYRSLISKSAQFKQQYVLARCLFVEDMAQVFQVGKSAISNHAVTSQEYSGYLVLRGPGIIVDIQHVGIAGTDAGRLYVSCLKNNSNSTKILVLI